MGAGHSGSTILGVALGNCEGFVFTGELAEWTLRAGVPVFGGTERNRFWSGVGARMADASDAYGSRMRDCVERASAAVRVDRWAARRRLRKRYREVAQDLYDAVAETAGASYIVDTSHVPLRAQELQALEGIELYLVFLVRDPHAVVASYMTNINRHASVERLLRLITKNVDLWLINLLSLRVFLRQPPQRRMFLRHEEFLADPRGVLQRLLTWCGSSQSPPDLAAMKTGYPVQGNPLLWSEEVAFRPEPPREPRRFALTTLLQAPWSLLFARLRPAATATLAGAERRQPSSVAA
jgi:hypothetical protein